MITKKPLFSWVFERCRGLQFLLFVMVLATIFFRVFPLEMQKRIINSAIAFKKLDLLLLYSGLYIGAGLLAGALKYAINVLQGYIAQKILLEIRERLYNHILTLPLSFFRSTPAGMVITSLTSELSVVGEFMGGALAIPVINILTLFAFAAYLAHLNFLLAIVSFSIYPIEIIIIPLLQRRFNRFNQHRIDITRSFSNVIGEAISGMHEIHGNAAYQLEGTKLGQFASSLFTIRNRMNIVKFLIKFTNNFFQSLGPFILFLLGGYLTIQGRLDLGALVAFLSAYEKLYDPWKELMDYYQDLQDSRVRYRQIMEYFDVKPEFELEPPDDRSPIPMEGRIEIRDLSYVVDNQIRILDQISLNLDAGEQLGLVGLSGSGKTTLALIMGQLYSYNGGHVLIDGNELKSLTKFDVSNSIGYVAQQPFIFDGAISENILYACQSLLLTSRGRSAAHALPDRTEILRVVEQVGLTEDILKAGFDTILHRNSHDAFARKIVEVRKEFHKRWGSELTNVAEFLDVNKYQYHSSIAENLTFGYSELQEYQLDALPHNPIFREFLTESKIAGPLLSLGAQLARQTVFLLKDLQDDAFFFEMSPIRVDEFDEYETVVERLNKSGETAPGGRDVEALLRLALRFIPARHKMAAFPPGLEQTIVAARRRFMEKMTGLDPEAIMFYRSTEYIYTQSVLTNILFGYPKADHPQAVELLRQRVAELAREEGVLDEIMGMGLEFQVGSKGDRLSGGQKQKIAIARALLKNPRILIMDEATASLDNASQAHIQQLFNTELKGKCTLVSVVHRLELVKDYDCIAVMKAGRIVETGRFDELMKRKGLFYELAHGAQ